MPPWRAGSGRGPEGVVDADEYAGIILKRQTERGGRTQRERNRQRERERERESERARQAENGGRGSDWREHSFPWRAGGGRGP